MRLVKPPLGMLASKPIVMSADIELRVVIVMQVSAKVAAAEEGLRAEIARLEADLREARASVSHERQARRQDEANHLQQAHTLNNQVSQLQQACAEYQEELKG